jgi:DNA ligase 1
MKGISEATGRSMEQLRADMTEHGDLGVVAHVSRGKQKTLSFLKPPPPLTVASVFARLKEMANMSGGKVCRPRIHF